jgi:hypothetical protein
MNNPNQTERFEIIEQALLESVSGGRYDTSGFSTCAFGCGVDLCSITCTTPTRTPKAPA